MSLVNLNPEMFESMAQAFRNNTLVAMAICDIKTPLVAQQGDTIQFPTLSRGRRQSYVVGTDAEFNSLEAGTDSLVIDQDEVYAFAVDPVQKLQAAADYEAQYAGQAIYELNNSVDQKVLAEGTNGANTVIAGGAMTSSTIYTKVSELKAGLRRKRATTGKMFLVIDPERSALIEQSGYASAGYTTPDSMFKNGFAGLFNGFNVFVSNNLPTSVTLTMDTNPTAGDTFTIDGVTGTWVANGTAAAAGELSIGANVAASKLILVDFLNGAGTPGASTYIEVATADRDTLVNDAVSCAAFSGDDAVITGHNLLGATETFTAATNVFGTETTKMLGGVVGGVALALQMAPKLYSPEDSKRPGVINYMARQLHGETVFENCKNDLGVITCDM